MARGSSVWLQQADIGGSLAEFMNPSLLPDDRMVPHARDEFLGS